MSSGNSNVGVLFNCFVNNALRAIMSGRGMCILFSNLLLTAASRTQGIFVAPRTRTPCSSFVTPFHLCEVSKAVFAYLAFRQEIEF